MIVKEDHGKDAKSGLRMSKGQEDKGTLKGKSECQETKKRGNVRSVNP
jgi:hypothetical protein